MWLHFIYTSVLWFFFLKSVLIYAQILGFLFLLFLCWGRILGFHACLGKHSTAELHTQPQVLVFFICLFCFFVFKFPTNFRRMLDQFFFKGTKPIKWSNTAVGLIIKWNGAKDYSLWNGKHFV